MSEMSAALRAQIKNTLSIAFSNPHEREHLLIDELEDRILDGVRRAITSRNTVFEADRAIAKCRIPSYAGKEAASAIADAITGVDHG